MSHADLPGVVKQEETLIFDHFDEDTAIAVLEHARALAKAIDAGVGVLVKFWDRPLAFGATRGYTHGNYLWAHRKANTVRLMLRSSYRVLIEQDEPKSLFEPRWGLPAEDYAISGGAFPITLKGVGVVGAAVMSGLHERDDHELIVAALAQTLGIDPTSIALPPRKA